MWRRSASSELGCLIVVAIMLPVLFVMKGFASIGAPSDYRYRLTLYVEGPEGPAAYSGVRQVKYMSDFSLEGQKLHREGQTGEAIPMKFPDGRVYFAIADEQIHPQHVALAAAARKLDPKAKREQLPLWRVKGEHQLPEQIDLGTLTGSHWDRGKEVRTWPTIVTFDYTDQPGSLRIVQPSEISVTRATIQITDDEPEHRINAYFAPDFWDRWKTYKEAFYRDRTPETNFGENPSYRYGPEQFR
jgi:hypothetical protein